MKNSFPKLVLILGPTAVGKSELAFKLSKDYDFEVISADSLLVYKHLNIGSAKPERNILNRIPHHLIDIIDPSEEFNAGKFKKLAEPIIQKLYDSKKKILVVGGTYLYIKTLTEGLISNLKIDRQFRDELRLQSYLYGNKYIYNKLKEVDIDSSEKINCNDYVRIERALEVHHTTGIKMSELQKDHGFRDKKYDVLKIGLNINNDDLKIAIENRMNEMLNRGLVKEVQVLLQKGYSKNIKPLKSIGYKEVVGYLNDRGDLDYMRKQIIKNTKRLAKKQMTWLKKDIDIKWFTIPYNYDEIKKEIEIFYSLK